MLTRYDEFPCHQIVSTFNHVDTSAREWMERVIMHHHDMEGRFHLTCGIGWYPNRNVIDAFACFAVEGKTQYTVVASRELRPKIDVVEIGPFSYDIIEPLKKIRYSLGKNKYNLSYDLEFEANMPCHEEEPQFSRSRGRVVENVVRYDQTGRVGGWIKVGGKTYQVDKKNWLVERDHSWGIRRGGADMVETGVQPREYGLGTLYSWAAIQFPKWGACYHIREEWDEKLDAPRIWHFSGGIFYPQESKKEEIKLDSIDHNFKVRPDNRRLESGHITLNGADGSKKEISLQAVGAVNLSRAGYGAFEGFIHGIWLGESFLDGVKLDLTDPNIAGELFWNTDCKFKCGNQVGYGVVELLVVGKYPKYGF